LMFFLPPALKFEAVVLISLDKIATADAIAPDRGAIDIHRTVNAMNCSLDNAPTGLQQYSCLGY